MFNIWIYFQNKESSKKIIVYSEMKWVYKFGIFSKEGNETQGVEVTKIHWISKHNNGMTCIRRNVYNSK